MSRDAGRLGNVLGFISKVGYPIAVALILRSLVVGHVPCVVWRRLFEGRSRGTLSEGLTRDATATLLNVRNS